MVGGSRGKVPLIFQSLLGLVATLVNCDLSCKLRVASCEWKVASLDVSI